MTSYTTDVHAQHATTIREHDVDETGDCVAFPRGGLVVESPWGARLLAELQTDQLAGTRPPTS